MLAHKQSSQQHFFRGLEGNRANAGDFIGYVVADLLNRSMPARAVSRAPAAGDTTEAAPVITEPAYR
jgi:hypothetical protein